MRKVTLFKNQVNRTFCKNLTYLSVLLILPCATAVEVNAKGPGGGDHREKIREKMLERFDENGDRQLDEKEKANAKEFRKQQSIAGKGRKGKGPMHGKMRQRMLEQYDENNDGELDESEKENLKLDMLAKWDKDGDGELSEEEKGARREEFKKQIEEYRKNKQESQE
ncbi:MAG: hypothetical protein AAGA18_10510 [Verrucomicrobiota bacterium]